MQAKSEQVNIYFSAVIRDSKNQITSMTWHLRFRQSQLR